MDDSPSRAPIHLALPGPAAWPEEDWTPGAGYGGIGYPLCSRRYSVGIILTIALKTRVK